MRVVRKVSYLIGFLISIYLVFEFSMTKTVFKHVDFENIDVLPTESKLSLVMVGDTLIHNAVASDAYHDDVYDFTKMLRYIKPIISTYDLAYYNQESILGGTSIGVSSYPRFNSPQEIGDAMIDAGFNLVSLANNHTLDRGEQAIINSCNYWKSKDVYYAGSYCSEEDRNNVKIMQKNGIKYALLSYTIHTNGIPLPNGKSYYANIYNPDIVKADVEKYRDKVDLLMVAMHWGEEYTHNPTAAQRNQAKYLADLGVDIIIGTHPHVVEPIEKIGDTLVIYSLGNFLSSQIGIERLVELMVSVDVVKKPGEDKIKIDNVEVELLYDYYSKNRDDFRIIPFTQLTDEFLPNHEVYYNKYMNIVTNGQDWIKRGDYSGNSK